MFKTAYGEKDHYYSPTGEKIELRHRAEIDKEGRRRLVKDKKVAIYDLIQASREECEIENIIRRATMGDANALNKGNAVYADITGMPKSIAEAQQLIMNLKENFDKLPKDVKAKFEYNAEMYVAEYGSEEWAEKTGLKAKLEKQAKDEAFKAKLKEAEIKAITNLAQGETIIQKGEPEE